MFTSLLGIALEVMVSAISPTPAWQLDYKHARAVAARDHRPLVVIVGSGAEGWNKLVSEGRFQDAADVALRCKYVWVYIDVNSEKGRKLADDFQMKSGPGLIISGRGGDLQAYRRVGALDAKGLNEVLTRYVGPDQTVRRTEQAGEEAVQSVPSTSYYQPNPLSQCLT